MISTLNFASIMIMLLGITFMIIQVHKRILDCEFALSKVVEALRLLADTTTELTHHAKKTRMINEMEFKKLYAQIQEQGNNRQG
jgi:hypothetical protein